MSYATRFDLADFMGTAEEDLPFDADRLLDRASELIDFVTFKRARYGNKDVVMKATCAQVEYIINIGEEFDVIGSPSSTSLGDFNIDQKFKRLAPRAERILFIEGLITHSVDMI